MLHPSTHGSAWLPGINNSKKYKDVRGIIMYSAHRRQARNRGYKDMGQASEQKGWWGWEWRDIPEDGAIKTPIVPKQNHSSTMSPQGTPNSNRWFPNRLPALRSSWLPKWHLNARWGFNGRHFAMSVWEATHRSFSVVYCVVEHK